MQTWIGHTQILNFFLKHNKMMLSALAKAVVALMKVGMVNDHQLSVEAKNIER